MFEEQNRFAANVTYIDVTNLHSRYGKIIQYKVLPFPFSVLYINLRWLMVRENKDI